MNRHILALAALVAVVGCGTDGPSLVAADPVPNPPQTRAQKPDAEPAAQTVASLGPPQVPPKMEGEVIAKARALVNGEVILDSELHQVTMQQLALTDRLAEPERSAKRNEIVRAELERLIEREIILSDAMAKLKKNPGALDKLHEAADKEFKKQVRSMKERAEKQGFKCQTDEQFSALLEAQGMSMDALRRQSERSFMAMEYMRHLIYGPIETLGHREIREYYDEHPGEFQVEDRIKWLDIFICTAKFTSPAEARRLADQLAERARKGEDFLELSKKYDDGDSAIYRQGCGYGQKHGEIRPQEAEQVLFRMREGEVGPVIETFNGFHVVKLVEREYAGLHAFDDKTQQEIKKKLQGIIADREYKRVLENLKRQAKVVLIND
jgi:parvulin-like peptidyl-prolyl isomerase